MATLTDPRCGLSWEQRGEKSGHCTICHETYYGLTAFDAHQHLADGTLTCHRDTATANGTPIPWWQDDDGQWHRGERMTEEQKRERGWVA